MKLKNRKPLGLEALEDRWVPATVHFDGSNLVVSNPLITGGKSQLSVTEQTAVAPAPNSPIFTVMDGATSNGSFLVTGNITINGNNASDQIGVFLTGTGTSATGTGLAGNLSITTGNGTSSVTIDGTTSAALGFIAGNVNVSMGSGSNSVWVGSKQPTPAPPATPPAFSGTSSGLFVRGNVSLSSQGNSGNHAFVNNTATPPPWIFSGNTNISGFPNVILGAVVVGSMATTSNSFSGNVTVSDTINDTAGTVTVNGAIQGNFSVLGSVGGNTTVAINNNVLGSTTLNLGNGTNSVALGGGAVASVTLNNLNYIAGNGTNVFTANGKAGNTTTLLKNANVHLGNGANSFGASTGLTVNGSLFINDGNGGLNVATNTFQGNVFGSLGVNLGNGNNAFTLDGVNGGNVLGTFDFTGGNGGNSVTVTTVAGELFTLNTRFGNGSANLFTIGTAAGVGFAPGTLTGTITWSIPTAANLGPPAVNGYVDNGYVWTNIAALNNVPS